MAKLQIMTHGNPVLKERAREVDCSGEDLSQLIEDLKETMYGAPGIGLAASQCGVMKRVAVFDVDETFEVIVNPEIVSRCDDLEEDEEGCLSVPDVKITIERPCHVVVRGQDAKGDPIEIEADGLKARVLQHEIDHLDGLLILDRATRAERKRAIKQQQEAERARAGLPVDEHIL